MKRIENPNELLALGSQLRAKFKERFISISSGTCGQARGSIKVVETFKEETKGKIDIKATGCHGFCEAEHISALIDKRITPKGIENLMDEKEKINDKSGVNNSYNRVILNFSK